MTVSLNFANLTYEKKLGMGARWVRSFRVLPVCLGKGTKVIEFLSDSGKVCEGRLPWALRRMEDASGAVVERTPLSENHFQMPRLMPLIEKHGVRLPRFPPCILR